MGNLKSGNQYSDFFSEKDCKCCGVQMTLDDERNYNDLCYKCCSEAWKCYEIAHGGQCKTDIKKRHITKSIKEMVITRDGKKCLKCQSETGLTIDHITPISKGGDNDLNNLQTLCRKCNSQKSDTMADFREVV